MTLRIENTTIYENCEHCGSINWVKDMVLLKVDDHKYYICEKCIYEILVKPKWNW